MKKQRKERVPKTRNNGKWTEAQFFSWLRSTLRRASMRWSPISEVKKKAKVPYIGPNKRRKVSFVCSICKQPYDSKQVDVHHIEPAGSLRSFEDLAGFCERLFVEEHKLILLCEKCHAEQHI